MFRRLPAAVVALCCVAASLSGGSAANAQQAVPDILPLTTASGSAQTLAPGFYSGDVLTGATRYGKVARSATETITVSLVTAPSLAANNTSVSIELQLPDGTTCVQATTSSSGTDGVSGMQAATVSVEPTPTKRGTSYLPKGCSRATELMLAVKKSDGPRIGGHLLVTTEPRTAGNSTASAGSAQTPPLAPNLETAGKSITAQHSYPQAATVTTGSYALALNPRQLQTFRVRVGWGQQVGVSLEAPRNGTNFAPSMDTQVGLTLWSPQLVPINAISVGKKSSQATLTANDSSPRSIATGSSTVAWNNRNADVVAPDSGLSTSGLMWASVAGWYYLTVWSNTSAPPATSTPTTTPQAARSIPTSLNIIVKGTATAGPNYIDASGGAIVGPEPTTLSRGGDSPGLPWIRIGLSALVLVLAALAVVRSLARRERT